MIQLRNPILSLTIDAENGTFDILPADSRLLSLTGCRLRVDYSLNGMMFTSLANVWHVSKTSQRRYNSSAQGEVEEVTVQTEPDGNGISFKLQFGIVQEYPLIIWRIEANNQGAEPIIINRIELLEVDPGQGGKVHFSEESSLEDLGFFSNGWQSWSPSRWYSADSRMNISRLGFLQHPMIYNPGTPLPKKKGVFSSDMFAVIGDRTEQTGFLVGFLSQQQHLGSILMDFNNGHLQMWANGDDARLDPEKVMTTDWAVFNPILLDHRDPLEVYLEAVARENHVRKPAESPAGWCSWYHFYTNVTARDVEQNLESIVRQQETLPLQLVQIDDGFESCVGDWLSFNGKFPQGVAPLAERIKKEGYEPGLWLAPFIVDPRSALMNSRPEWLLRTKTDCPVNAGFVWNRLCTGLDLTIPEALEYVKNVVKIASEDWGFPYLKLDFLYAASLVGRYHDGTKTRAQVLRMGLEAIREAVGPEITLLGCGAPLGPSLGIFDAMRIGPDVSGNWAPKFHGIRAFIKKEPSFPSARNSISNILTRANLHGRWWVNDPDCLLVRSDTRLSLAEVQSLAAAIALTGGSLLLSDDLPNLPEERLRIAESLLPVIGELARIIDWFDAEMPSKLRLDLLNAAGEYHVMAAFNWQDGIADLHVTPGDFHLAEGSYLTSEFWNGQIGVMSAETPLVFQRVPAHGCAVIAVRRFDARTPSYIGSDLHISQGIELVEWNTHGQEVEFTLRLNRSTSGKVFLYLPAGIRSVEVNDSPAFWDVLGSGIYAVEVSLDGFAHVRVR